MNKIATACKARAAADYDKYNTFVECYTDSEWSEFVIDYKDDLMTQDYAFKLMDDMVSVWADRQSNAVNSAF